jgi:hypothetical protein
MIRFFVTAIWKHPAIQGYQTVMRLDADACWRPKTPWNETYPDLPSDKVYHANSLRKDPPKYCKGIYELTKEYITKTNITVAYPRMWLLFEENYLHGGQHCLGFYNNFEVVRVKFMQQFQVQHWHEAVTEQAPFGVFRVRWGDAIVRYLTMALFAERGSVIQTKKKGQRDTNIDANHNRWSTLLIALHNERQRKYRCEVLLGSKEVDW